MARYLGSKIFDSGAEKNYNNLRFIPWNVLNYISELIFNLSAQANSIFLDAGCGNGRYFFPLLEVMRKNKNPYFLIGVDNSSSMIKSLQKKLKNNKSIKVKTIIADLEKKLKIKSGPVNVVFSAATFHIFKDWKAAASNLADIIKTSGYFVIISEYNQFMHQTEGFEHDNDFPYLNNELSLFMTEYHRLRNKFNFPYPPSEVRYSDMTKFFYYLTEELDFQKIKIHFDNSRLLWEKPHKYSEIIKCLQYRQMTTWGSDMEDNIRIPIAKKLDNWLKINKVDKNEIFYLPARLEPHIFRKE